MAMATASLAVSDRSHHHCDILFGLKRHSTRSRTPTTALEDCFHKEAGSASFVFKVLYDSAVNLDYGMLYALVCLKCDKKYNKIIFVAARLRYAFVFLLWVLSPFTVLQPHKSTTKESG